MPRKKSIVSEVHVNALKELVRARSNNKCSRVPDITLLQAEIEKVTGLYISVQTLNRFFGLIKNTFNPDLKTLDILSRYAGYNSYLEFTTVNGFTHEQKDLATMHHEYEVILTLLAGIEPNHINDKGLLQIARNIYKVINTKEELAEPLFVFMANNSFGRKYFFEQFVNIDKLNGYYGSGLRYYLLHTLKREEAFFALNVLCLKCFLSQDKETFSFYLTKIRTYSLDEIETFHPFIIGRYCATLCFNSHMNGQDVDLGHYQQKFSACDKNATQENYRSFPCLEYMYAEGLILTTNFSKAYELLNEQYCRDFVLPDYQDEGYAVQLDIFRLTAGFFSGKLTAAQAGKQLDDLVNKKVYFLSQDYFSLYLHLLKLALENKPAQVKKLKENIKHLIHKSGFTYFEALQQYVEKKTNQL